MNKIFIVFLAAAIIIAIGIFLGTGLTTCPVSGKTVNIHMTVGSWYFDPETIRVNCGDKVIIEVYNENDYDHGFGLDLFGINKRIIAKKTETIEFLATERGTFIYYCTVPCGSGVDKITNLPKGHFEQKGKIVIS